MFIVHGNYDWEGFAEVFADRFEARKRVAHLVEADVSPLLPDDEFQMKIDEAQDGGKWKHGPTIQPIKAAIVTTSKAGKARLALAMLRAARDLLDEAGSKRAAQRVREVLASSEDAGRAAEMRDQRDREQTNATPA